MHGWNMVISLPDRQYKQAMTVLLGIIVVWLCGCAPGFILHTSYLPVSGPWADGTYTATQDLPTPQLLVVEVDVAQGQIAAIHVRQHPAWQAPQEQELLLRRVLEQQTTAVYEPRHDGSEQDLLLRIIEEALYKARRQTSSEP